MCLFFNLRRFRKKFFICLCVALAVVLVYHFSFSRSDAVSVVSTAEGYYVPVIMYHSILKDESRHGKYVVSPQQLESDLMYLAENGYTSITVADLLSYVEEGTPLPEKPVMLTFDDGYYNNYLYAYPLMRKYGFKMVLSVIGKYAEVYSNTADENAYYSHCTWEQLTEMGYSGLVEIQNHSYDLHTVNNGRNGTRKNSRESLEEYRSVLSADIVRCQTLLAENVGVVPKAFTYPFGAISAESVDIIKDLGFEAAFSCEEKINLITRDPECLFCLDRFLRPMGESSSAYFENKVKLNKYVNISE